MVGAMRGERASEVWPWWWGEEHQVGDLTLEPRSCVRVCMYARVCVVTAGQAR